MTQFPRPIWKVFLEEEGQQDVTIYETFHVNQTSFYTEKKFKVTKMN